MKKFIISGVCCSVLLLGGFQIASAAETTTMTQESKLSQIEKLMKVIADMQAKINVTKGEIKELSADLTEGAQGDDVKKVQEILASDPAIFGAKATGFFGPMTREALKKFQEKYGLEVTGKLDADTRALMKEYRSEMKDGKVPPGLIKSKEVKDKIKARLQAKWGDCDFGEKFRASDCKKGKADKVDSDDDDAGDVSITRDVAKKAVGDAQKALDAFKKEVKAMKADGTTKDELDEAVATLKEAQTELLKARKAFLKRDFKKSFESANEAMEIIEGDDDENDEDEGDDENETEDAK